MESQKKVNLFIVGAMKAGTTSFTELLAQHSEIYVSPIKEPHFFVDGLPATLYEPSRFFNLDNYLKKEFPKPLHITKIENEVQYEKIYSLAGSEKYRVDASTAYLHAPEAPERIYNYNPDAKIIILLRDPLKRAFSHYKMDIGIGRVNTSFENCMQQQMEFFKNGELPWHSYLNMSCYDAMIERYTKLFNNVICIHFERILSDTDSVFREITKKLDITAFSEIDFNHLNSSLMPRYRFLWYWGKQLGLKNLFSQVFSSKIKQSVFQKLSKKSGQFMELSDKLGEELNEIFKEHSKTSSNQLNR